MMKNWYFFLRNNNDFLFSMCVCVGVCVFFKYLFSWSSRHCWVVCVCIGVHCSIGESMSRSLTDFLNHKLNSRFHTFTHNTAKALLIYCINLLAWLPLYSRRFLFHCLARCNSLESLYDNHSDIFFSFFLQHTNTLTHV